MEKEAVILILLVGIVVASLIQFGYGEISGNAMSYKEATCSYKCSRIVEETQCRHLDSEQKKKWCRSGGGYYSYDEAYRDCMTYVYPVCMNY